MAEARTRARATGRPTSFDIAYLAGVSQPTVSRALRGSTSVSEATRRKVEAIARQLNYTVDKNASNLRFQHSNTLAVLFFEDATGDDQLINPFFLAMVGTITRACSQRGYDLLISFQELGSDWHVAYEDSRKADGIILLGYGDYWEYQSRLEKLVAQGTHFVRWGAVLEGQPGLSVGCDNFRGGREAAAPGAAAPPAASITRAPVPAPRSARAPSSPTCTARPSSPPRASTWPLPTPAPSPASSSSSTATSKAARSSRLTARALARARTRCRAGSST